MTEHRQLEVFGNHLKILRFQARIRTQKDVIARLKIEGIEASQSLLAKYELGSVLDPDVTILKALAKIYNASYDEMIELLVLEKYY